MKTIKPGCLTKRQPTFIFGDILKKLKLHKVYIKRSKSIIIDY